VVHPTPLQEILDRLQAIETQPRLAWKNIRSVLQKGQMSFDDAVEIKTLIDVTGASRYMKDRRKF
jgi:hypothetical protein